VSLETFKKSFTKKFKKSASIVIFAEIVWTPGLVIQAEDRAHRIGQKKVVNIIFLILKKSFEEIMWRVIDKKIRNVARILDNNFTSKGMKINNHTDQPEKEEIIVKTPAKTDKDVVDDKVDNVLDARSMEEDFFSNTKSTAPIIVVGGVDAKNDEVPWLSKKR